MNIRNFRVKKGREGKRKKEKKEYIGTREVKGNIHSPVTSGCIMRTLYDCLLRAKCGLFLP